MNKMVVNRMHKQSVEQKGKQLERSKARYQARQIEREPVRSNHPPINQEDIQREKRLRKRAQKQLGAMQKSIKNSRQLVLEKNQQIRDFEKEKGKLEQERFELRQQVSTMKVLEAELVNRDKQIKFEQEHRKEAEQTMQMMTTHHADKQKYGKKKVDTYNQVKQLKEVNKALRKQLENYDLLTQEKYEKLLQELKVLRKEVHVFRNREHEIKKNPMLLVDYMKQHITSGYLPDLLDMVQNHMTTENLPHFYSGEQNIFYLLMRRINMLNFRNQKRISQYQLNNRTNSDDHQRLGYLSYQHDKWLFVDMTQANYPIVYDVLENTSNEPLTMDKPAKATLHQYGVIITKCFSMEVPEQIQQKKRQTNLPSKKEFLWFGNFNVLIIGSRFLSDYKDRLEKHGCSARLHNPFEESYQMLKAKTSRAEIILVCERHIPHSIWEHVDKKQPYVTALKQDSKDLISTFTYLTLQRCELI